ncbi:MAG: hypothetical protein NW216_06750 [Hyphomicrobium sp.]|nr:hypothetical protein [Hyphomicrobium sp.]
MADEELQSMFGGAEVDGHYRSGRVFAEHYMAGGRVLYSEGPDDMGGRWSVTAGTFCTLYDNDPSGGCYRVRRESDNCFEFYFVARTEETARADPGRPSWTARVWLRSRPSTCAEKVGV